MVNIWSMSSSGYSSHVPHTKRFENCSFRWAQKLPKSTGPHGIHLGLQSPSRLHEGNLNHWSIHQQLSSRSWISKAGAHGSKCGATQINADWCRLAGAIWLAMSIIKLPHPRFLIHAINVVLQYISLHHCHHHHSF